MECREFDHGRCVAEIMYRHGINNSTRSFIYATGSRAA